MRNKIIFALLVVCFAILAWNLTTIFLVLPDELNQGPVYRIIYFHVPSAILSLTGFGVGMACSIGYLVTRKATWDAVAEGITEVSLVFATIALITGSIWGRIAWGVWWAWDVRLTSFLVCWLVFAGYLMLRRAIDEPIRRAQLSSVVSVFGTVDAFIVWKSIEWYRNQHPGPVLSVRNGGGMAPGMETPIWWNLLALVLLSSVLVMVRMRQEAVAREIDTLRRTAHTL